MTDYGKAVVTATEVNVDYAKFSKTYDVYEVASDVVLKRTSLATEIARCTDKVLSVYRQYRSTCFYVLARKESLSLGNLRSALDKADDACDVRIRKLPPLEQSPENDRMVVSLLLRSLAYCDDPLYARSNTSGRFLTLQECDKEAFKVHPVEITLDDRLRLHFVMRTFTSLALRDKIRFRRDHGAEAYPVYAVDGATMRRVLRDESVPEELQYIERQTYDDKYVKTYVNIYEEAKFSETRAAVVLETVRLFNERFKHLASITLKRTEIECLVRAPLDGGLVRTERINFVRQRGVRVVSVVGDEISKRAADLVASRLQESLAVPAVRAETTDDGALNVRIVGEKPKGNGMVDDYLVHGDATIVQHMTHEPVLRIAGKCEKTREKGGKASFQELDRMLDVCCNELSIKHEIATRRLLAKSQEVLLTEGAVFMMRFQTGPLSERLAMLAVSSDGALDFKLLSTKELGGASELFDWMLLENEVMAKGLNPSSMEGAVKTPTGVAAIVHTGMVTMPEDSAIEHLAKAKPFAVPTSMLEELLNSELLSDGTRSHLRALVDDATGAMISSRKLDDIKGYGREEAKRIRAEIDEHIAAKFDRTLRVSRNDKTITEHFNGLFGIGAITVDDLACYWVGPPRKNINQSVANAAQLRAVIALDGSSHDMRDAILPTLAIDIVRAGQMTVLPWLFKHLREWADIQARQIEASVS